MTQRYYARPIPLSTADQEYLERFAESKSTQSTSRSALEAFTRFRLWHGRASRTPTPLAALDLDVLVDFRNWLHLRKYAALSRDTYVTLTASYLAYAQDKGWLAPDFSLERAKTRHKTTRKRHAYPATEVNPQLPRLIQHYDRLPVPTDEIERLELLRARSIMHLLYSSAGRVSEIASLTRMQIQDGRRDEAKIVGKGDKPRFIFFTAEAQTAVQAYTGARQDTFEHLLVYHRRRRGKPMSRQSIWSLVHDTAQSLGIGKVSPHDFRHYRASQMRNAGAPAETIQAILGHADISTTLRVYAHLEKAKAREMFDKTYIPTKDAAK